MTFGISYWSFDIRDNIRNKIGTARDVDGDDQDELTISVVDDWNDTIYIPLFVPADVRTGEMPNMPFVEMTMVDTPVRTHNVQGDVKFQEAYIDFNIYYTNTDHISATTFGRVVADEIVSKITDNRHSVPSCYFCEVINDGREIIESYNEGKSVVFHRVVSIYCNNYFKD